MDGGGGFEDPGDTVPAWAPAADDGAREIFPRPAAGRKRGGVSAPTELRRLGPKVNGGRGRPGERTLENLPAAGQAGPGELHRAPGSVLGHPGGGLPPDSARAYSLSFPGPLNRREPASDW